MLYSCRGRLRRWTPIPTLQLLFLLHHTSPLHTQLTAKAHKIPSSWESRLTDFFTAEKMAYHHVTTQIGYSRTPVFLSSINRTYVEQSYICFEISSGVDNTLIPLDALHTAEPSTRHRSILWPHRFCPPPQLHRLQSPHL